MTHCCGTRSYQKVRFDEVIPWPPPLRVHCNQTGPASSSHSLARCCPFHQEHDALRVADLPLGGGRSVGPKQGDDVSPFRFADLRRDDAPSGRARQEHEGVPPPQAQDDEESWLRPSQASHQKAGGKKGADAQALQRPGDGSSDAQPMSRICGDGDEEVTRDEAFTTAATYRCCGAQGMLSPYNERSSVVIDTFLGEGSTAHLLETDSSSQCHYAFFMDWAGDAYGPCDAERLSIVEFACV
jgi:hypothetical protein